jgi:hypothetical protein
MSYRWISVLAEIEICNGSLLALGSGQETDVEAALALSSLKELPNCLILDSQAYA